LAKLAGSWRYMVGKAAPPNTLENSLASTLPT
jgi:hypothetical protein